MDPRSEYRKPASTVRVASWSAQHGGWVAVLWLAGTVGLFALSLALGGIKVTSTLGGASQTDAARAAEVMSAGDQSEPLNVVVASSQLTASDPAFRAAVDDVIARLRKAGVADLADPYLAAPAAGLISQDRGAVRIVGRLNGSQAARTEQAPAIDAALAEARRAHSGVEIHAVSDALLGVQMVEEINRDMDGSLVLSIPATFLILLVAFGALVAAAVPLVLAVSALLGAFGIVGLFSQVVEPMSPFAGQFIVLIGLAVAVDYSLFVITRFRSERAAGRDKPAAIAAASATSGRAVLFSGVAVMISLGALFLLPDPMFQSIAIGTIAVIAVSVAGSCLFLPASLAILGDRLDRGRLPRLGRREGPDLWRRVVGAATGRPVLAAIVATVALLILASPVARLRIGEMDSASLPGGLDGVRAIGVLQDRWPQGALLGLDVVATDAARATPETIDRLESALLRIPGLSGPARTATAGNATVVSVAMSGGQNDAANWETVRRVRESVVPDTFGANARGVLVGGAAARSLDQTQIYADGIARIFAFVLGLSFVLLLLVFRSVAVALKAILLNLLAAGAAFGAMVLVFQEGFLAGPLGVTPGEAIQNFVPVFVFTVLFGLSMDYEVFILARVREAVDGGATTSDAVLDGIGRTAGTVTSAASIMVVVFAVFLTLPLPIARELGLGLMVAVFVDATLIRTVLLPATMRLLGEWNWWLPWFLEWLPKIELEAGLGPVPPAAVAPVPSSTPVPARLAEPRLLPSGTTGRPR